MDALKVKSLATVVDSNGAVTKGLYIADPSYTGELDWSGTNTDGFIKILETSTLNALNDSGYSWNTSDVITANYTTDTYKGSEIMVFYTSPDGLYRLVGQFSGNDSTGGTYGRIFLGVQIWSTENTGSTEYKWLGSSDTFVNNGHVPRGVQLSSVIHIPLLPTKQLTGTQLIQLSQSRFLTLTHCPCLNLSQTQRLYLNTQRLYQNRFRNLLQTQ